MIVLIETEISGMYRVVVDYTNELEENIIQLNLFVVFLMNSMA